MSNHDTGRTSRKQSPGRPPEVDQYMDRFLTTVCDTTRRYILELLAIPDEGALPSGERRSGDIAKALGLSPATISEHLHQLADLGLVVARREGNTVYYRLRNHQLMKAFQALLLALETHYPSIHSGD